MAELLAVLAIVGLIVFLALPSLLECRHEWKSEGCCLGGRDFYWDMRVCTKCGYKRGFQIYD